MKLNEGHMQATISAPTTKILYKLMEKYHLDSEAIFKKAGLKKRDLTNVHKRISYNILRSLWQTAAEQIDDPCFGLKGVEIWHPSDISALGYAWLTSATMRDALDRFKNYITIATEFYQFRLEETKSSYELIFDFKDKKTLNMAQADASMAIVMEMCRVNLDHDASPILVTLTHSEPECRNAYYSYYGCPIKFSQPENKIILPLNIIDIPLLNSNPELAIINDQAMIQYLQKLNDTDIIHQVKKIITEHICFGISNDQVANALNMSERTLNRHLNEQGVTFKGILKDVRINLSKLYIKKGQFNVTEIAFQLGFSDSSSFSRAFKRWTGTSPKGYKAKQTADRHVRKADSGHN